MGNRVSTESDLGISDHQLLVVYTYLNDIDIIIILNRVSDGFICTVHIV